MADSKKTLFEQLNSIDVSAHVEKKGNGSYSLSYLSWVWAWSKIKEIDPDAKREYTKFDELNSKTGQLTGRKVDYMLTEQGCYVECTVTINGHSETESLYVMDFKNKAVKNPDMGQINKTKQRCFVKAVALQGLGLYIYAGEDLPVDDNAKDSNSNKDTRKSVKQNKAISDMEVGVLEDMVTQLSDETGSQRKDLIAFIFDKCQIKGLSGISTSKRDEVKEEIYYLRNRYHKKQIEKQRQQQEKNNNQPVNA